MEAVFGLQVISHLIQLGTLTPHLRAQASPAAGWRGA